MQYNWISTVGEFRIEGENIIFKGGTTPPVPDLGTTGPNFGMFICNQKFGGGSIEARVIFPEIDQDVSSCQLVLYYDSKSQEAVTAGFVLEKGNLSSFGILHFDGKKWITDAMSGSRVTIQPNREYLTKVMMQGSRIELLVDGVSVCIADLNFSFLPKQIGIFCRSYKDVVIKNFLVREEKAKAFVIMEFNEDCLELYKDVIKPICENYGVVAELATHIDGPGHIMSDIIKQIYASKFVIAEITSPNQNVFFEVGFSHGIQKPMILISEKEKILPFDISGFRVLFYENSIKGKKSIEEGLKRNIEAILAQTGFIRD